MEVCQMDKSNQVPQGRPDKQVKLTPEELARQQEGRRLKELCQQEGWVKVLFPLLEAQIRNSVVDPRSCKDEAEYVFKQKTAWAYGQAYSDLLTQIDSKVTDSEYLTDKEQGKIKDILAEAMS